MSEEPYYLVYTGSSVRVRSTGADAEILVYATIDDAQDAKSKSRLTAVSPISVAEYNRKYGAIQ